MNTRLTFLLCTVLVFAGSGAALANEAAPKQTRFHVEGMTCSLCSHAISKSVRALEGVHDVSVHQDEKRVEIVADPGVSAADLESAIESAGHFQAELEEEETP